MVNAAVPASFAISPATTVGTAVHIAQHAGHAISLQRTSYYYKREQQYGLCRRADFLSLS